MARLSFILAVIVLRHGDATGQSTSSDCGIQECQVQYWNERSEYTKPEQIEEYTRLCGSGYNKKCPTCRLLSRFEACVQERYDACKEKWDSSTFHQGKPSPDAQARFVKQSLRSELKEWINVCEAPCDRMESISQCETNLFTANAELTLKDKDKACLSFKAARTCIGKEAKECPIAAKYASEGVEAIASNWAAQCDPSCANIMSFFQNDDTKQPSCMNDFSKGMAKWTEGLGKAARSMRSPVEMCVLAKTTGPDCHVCKELKRLEACKDTAVGDCTGNSVADSVEEQVQGMSMMMSALCDPESSQRLFAMPEAASAALIQADVEQSGTTLAWLPFAAFGSLILVSLGALAYGSRRWRQVPSAPAGSSEEDAMLE